MEIFHLQIPFGGHFQRALGDKAHDLAADDGRSMAGRLGAHRFEDPVDGGLLEVGEVHGDLRQIARRQRHTHGFDVTESAGGEADGLGDTLRDFDIGGVQVDVVRDQEFARASDGGAGGGMQFGVAEIGEAIGIGAHLVAQAFELAAADVFQIDAVGAAGGGFIEIHGHLQAFPQTHAEFVRQAHAIFERDTFHWHERHHIDGADAGVDAFVCTEVDEADGSLDSAVGGFDYGCGWTGEGDDGAVVIGVHLAVQDGDAAHGSDGFDDGVYFGRVATFGEVGDTLYYCLGHGVWMVMYTLFVPK